MGRYGQGNKVGRLVGRGGEDDGINNNKVIGNVLKIQVHIVLSQVTMDSRMEPRVRRKA